jgi:repressor LexA
MDGDLLAVHNTPEARNGDIVVARINDEVTVKRFKQGKSKTELVFLPENEDFEPIIVGLNKDTVVIEGKSVGVMRLH